MIRERGGQQRAEDLKVLTALMDKLRDNISLPAARVEDPSKGYKLLTYSLRTTTSVANELGEKKRNLQRTTAAVG
jgi:hypothetical protein